MKNSNDDILWHYCSLDAFYNIIKSQSIRLSDIYQSNDYNERIGFHNFVSKQINTELSCNGMDTAQTAAFYYLAKSMDNTSYIPSNNFCFCLTNLEDSPLHWSYYGDNGRGIAIGFKRSALTFHTVSSSEHSISLLDMNYDHEKIAHQINQFIKAAEIEFAKAKNESSYETICRQLDQRLSEIYKYSKTYKSERLSCESESRLSIIDDFRSDLFLHEHTRLQNEDGQYMVLKPLDDYCTGNRIKSYYTLSWKDQFNNDGSSSFPIAKICIGFENHMSEAEIKNFVTNQTTRQRIHYEYEPLRKGLESMNLHAVKQTNTEINYLRLRENLDLDIMKSQLTLRNK